MRVISGSAKGYKLQAPKGKETRPTTDRIKESLFNMIQNDVSDNTFLDLFSGTGGIGIEALSRGAKKAVFIDESPVCNHIIQENLEHTRLKSKAEVYQGNCIAILRQLGKNNEKFDIIFMDPPYVKNLIEPTLKEIINNQLLAPDGYIIVERATKNPIPTLKNLVLWKEKAFKTTTMTFLRQLEETI